MSKAKDRQSAAEPFDSIDYCINFWEGALDAEDEIDQLHEGGNYLTAASIHASDDVA